MFVPRCLLRPPAKSQGSASDTGMFCTSFFTRNRQSGTANGSLQNDCENASVTKKAGEETDDTGTEEAGSDILVAYFPQREQPGPWQGISPKLQGEIYEIVPKSRSIGGLEL